MSTSKTSRKPAAKTAATTSRKTNKVSASSLRELRLKRPKPGEEGSSLVQQAVDALRKRILTASASNRFLGSEEQLMTALGVSRPTFRQAARLLAHEQLLKIKRGIGGGFFAQPPSADAVSRIAAIYLNSQQLTLLQLHDAIAPMMMEAARMLAKHPDTEVRQQLLGFLQENPEFAAHALPDRRAYFRVLLRYEQLLGALCGNPAVDMMISVMCDLVRDPRYSQLKLDRERVTIYADFMRRLAQTVGDGDSDMAMLIVKRHVKRVRSWLPGGGGED